MELERPEYEGTQDLPKRNARPIWHRRGKIRPTNLDVKRVAVPVGESVLVADSPPGE